jgi:hypothetical protein
MHRLDFTWQRLDIANWPSIQEELQALPMTIRVKQRSFTPLDTQQTSEQILVRCPRLCQYLSDQNLTVWAAGWVHLAAGEGTPPHIDCYGNAAVQPTLALQLPIQNCESSRTLIYHSKTDRNHYKRSIFKNWRYDPADLTLIDSYQLTEPLLFNIRHIHQVQNTGSELRLALSLRFVKDPWHLITK